ncbi:serine/arginine repetitive matrix protein 1-like isoform X3 [Amphibalanus amphitrite]|uniref:serine/arginine repetitive matrix protein 1-like isoform X3 n=1 Tax=Amphibalanus amphitrite TaxID=1232801 RepID=UPI001C90B718|nr:serine/arginine repetitive matrix protein 1-like isoform X3 [Amphibalanus amphitrite]
MAYRAQRAHHPYEEIEYDESPYATRPGPSRSGYPQREEQTYDYLPIQRPANRGGEMVSRRRILSRSRDDLNMEAYQEEEDDVWYKKEKLYSDHIREVLSKWDSIDDEIWAKIIVFERNRRVAKAYARVGVLTIHGSDVGFDGSKIGLGGFDNPLRDPKIEEVKRYIGAGVKIKMDNEGNMMVKKLAKSNVFVRYANGENAVGSDILKLPQAALEANKGLTMFDLKKFQQNVNRELKRQYPDRTRLETQCMTSLAFVKNEDDMLNCPCWVLVINIVALDMLKGKLMPGLRSAIPPSVPAVRSSIPIPDEDPYSVAGSGGSSGSSGRMGRSERPPKLPPRDTDRLPHRDIPNPDYGDDTDEQDAPVQNSGGGGGLRARLHLGRKKEKKERKKGDELYYGGFQARVPNFVKSKGSKEDPSAGRDPRELRGDPRLPVDPRDMRGYLPPAHPMQHATLQHQPQMWQQRAGYDPAMDDPYFSGLRVRVPGLRGGLERADSLLSSETDSTYSLGPEPRGRHRRRSSSRCRETATEQAAALYTANRPPTSRHGRHRSRRRSHSREHSGFPMVFPVAREPSPPDSDSVSPARRRQMSPAEVYSLSMSVSQLPPEREASPARRRAIRVGRERPHSPLGPRGSAYSPSREVSRRSAAADVEGAYVAGGREPVSPTGAEHRVEEMRERFEAGLLSRGRRSRRSVAQEK